jgi:hypothetical protein
MFVAVMHCARRQAWWKKAQRKLTIHPGGNSECEEIFLPGMLGGLIEIVKNKIVGQSLPHPGKFPQFFPVFNVTDR